MCVVSVCYTKFKQRFFHYHVLLTLHTHIICGLLNGFHFSFVCDLWWNVANERKKNPLALNITHNDTVCGWHMWYSHHVKWFNMHASDELTARS